MVTGACSIIPDSSCQLVSERGCRPRDLSVSKRYTWQFSVTDTGKILGGLRLRSDRLLQRSEVPQWRGGKSQWSRVGCLWFSAIRMSP